MYRKHIVASLIVAVTAMTAAAPAFAMDASQYAAGASTKLGRGVVNAVTGWGEIPKQTVIGSKEDGLLGGVGGFFKGIGLAVARSVVGGFEIATFWAPVPDRFEPVMQPATVFDRSTGSASAKTGSQSASR
jgi:putative exosortase-associated protein (TIGR04073 family)